MIKHVINQEESQPNLKDVLTMEFVDPMPKKDGPPMTGSGMDTYIPPSITAPHGQPVAKMSP